MKKPYVGVSGIVSREQADTIYHHAENVQLTDRRRILLGVKAVHKTQWLEIENKYGQEWYPVGRQIEHVADSTSYSGEFWVAQVFLDQQAAKEEEVIDYERRFIKKLMDRTNGWLDGVQFDMLPWHETDYRPLFDAMKRRQSELEILLQCQGPIMERHTPLQVGEMLEKYRGYVDHVLFDASHGTGKEMDERSLRPYLEETAARDQFGIGVAGGLNADRVARHMGSLLQDFPQLSFDAEGQLHKNDNGSSGLNMEATKQYLSAAKEVVR